jgi:cation diffusion facilitator CzcD-associated flavoprotein CzcO
MPLSRDPLRSPLVAVIGAGPCGLVATKTLKERGISVICFETGDRVGGLWAIKNKNGRGGAYCSLHINTSTAMTQFSDFPLPTNAGDFPSHSVMGRYFSDYADRFELQEVLRFGIEVRQCVPVADGYLLSLFDRTTKVHFEQRFDALVVANGHHWDPSFPQPLPTDGFAGDTLHSGSYMSPRDPVDVCGKRVLVVGIGNSAVDIACEICEAKARSVSVSSRRGARHQSGSRRDQPATACLRLPREPSTAMNRGT